MKNYLLVYYQIFELAVLLVNSKHKFLNEALFQ